MFCEVSKYAVEAQNRYLKLAALEYSFQIGHTSQYETGN